MRKISCLLVMILFLSIFTLGEEKFALELVKIKDKVEMVRILTKNLRYQAIPQALRLGRYLGYFAAQDFTHKKEMIMKEFKEIQVIKDTPKQKGVKVIYYLQDQNNQRVSDYLLEVNLEVRKEYPCLAMCSRLRYTGEGEALTGLNWGFSDNFRYYVVPEGGKVKAFKIERKGLLSGKATKIGKGAYPWIWFTDGKGKGLGMITDGMLVAGIQEGELQIGVSDAPPKKKLTSGESMEVVFIFLPTEKGYKPIKEIYSRARSIRWEVDQW